MQSGLKKREAEKASLFFSLVWHPDTPAETGIASVYTPLEQLCRKDYPRSVNKRKISFTHGSAITRTLF
jgi:hypothetical protein